MDNPNESQNLSNPQDIMTTAAEASKAEDAKRISQANMPSITNPWADEAKGQGNDWKFGPRGTDDTDKPWVKEIGPEGIPVNTNIGNTFDGGTDEKMSGVWNKGDFELEAGSDEEGTREEIIHQDMTNAVIPSVTPESAKPVKKEKEKITPEQKELKELKKIVQQNQIQIQNLLNIIQNNSTTIINPPESVPTPEVIDKEDKRKLRAAYIAGAVIGGSTGILGGIQAAGVGALACIAGGLLNTGLTKISEKSIERWNRRLQTVTDPTERAKLEKRVTNWSKVNNFCKTSVNDFLRGARHGLLASSIFSGVFLGGHGLAWNTGEMIPSLNPTSTNNGGSIGGGTETASGNIGGGVESQPFDSGLLQNGRVNLPGDPSNGNLATGPIGNLPGGAENFSNYAGGQSDMGWYKLNEYLNNAHIKASDLTAAGGDLHRMGYALQVDPTRTLPDLLNQFGGSNLLQP